MARGHSWAILIAMFHDVSHSNVGGHERPSAAARLQTASTNPRALHRVQPGLRWVLWQLTDCGSGSIECAPHCIERLQARR